MLRLWRRRDSIEFRCTYIVWIQVACVSSAVVGVAGVVKHLLTVVHCSVIVDVVLCDVHSSWVLIKACVVSFFYLYSWMSIRRVTSTVMSWSESAIVGSMEPIRDFLQVFLSLS